MRIVVVTLRDTTDTTSEQKKKGNGDVISMRCVALRPPTFPLPPLVLAMVWVLSLVPSPEIQG